VQIETITLSGFRSFGRKPTTVSLAGALTAVIGPNASGKTALLQALMKLFGVTRAQRTVHRSDFHLPPDIDPSDRTSRVLYIDVVIALPELAIGLATAATVAPTFRHIRIERPGISPVCRMRLDARWDDDGTADGEVTQELHWIDTLDSAIDEQQRHVLPPSERGLIQLYYTPASRDAASQIRATAGALAARLLRAIEWSAATKTAVETASKGLSSAFDAEAAITAIANALRDRWSALHDEDTDAEPRLALISRRFEEVVRTVSVVFRKGPAGIERGLEALSDGQQSLFYFALAAAVFDLERDAVRGTIEGFDIEDLVVPALSIFAIEEPENHLSPYYLARIVQQIRSLVADGVAQAIVTSHSPAVLSRVEPAEVRYCRCDRVTGLTSIRAIDLPKKDDEAIKFVRGAMLAFPELYFARFVILGEGDSERIVLPRLAQAEGLLLDPAFVAIVPLGGRHVQHFWRLLNGLGIPHATLLDLDLGRKGGGYGRLKTAIEQLIALGVKKERLLEISGGGIISDEDFAEWHLRNDEHLEAWANSLARYGVFFSAPLDIDLALLKAYPGAYEAIIPTGGGPELTIDEAAHAVLSKGGLALYDGDLKEYKAFFPEYRYHFLTHSKPAAHLQVLMKLDDEALRRRMPAFIRPLLEHVKKHLRRD
jgi:putative ATP-dependent endonuclease of OLD family